MRLIKMIAGVTVTTASLYIPSAFARRPWFSAVRR